MSAIAVWSNVKSKLTAVLDECRVARARRQFEQRRDARQIALLPLLDQLCQSQSPAAQATFPPVRDMLQFDSLKGLWEPDDAVQDAETFEAVKPAILAEATVFVQQFQVATFAELAKAHAASTADHDSEESPSEQPSATHSDTDMATLAGKVTSSFKCPFVTCRVMKPYPDILAHWRTAHPGLFVPFLFQNTEVPSGKMDDTTLQTSADYIQAIRSLLEAVDKEPSLPAATEEMTTVDDLDAIGSRFECISCRFYGNDLYVDSSPPPPPILRTWSELVRFSFQVPIVISSSRRLNRSITRPKVTETVGALRSSPLCLPGSRSIPFHLLRRLRAVPKSSLLRSREWFNIVLGDGR